MPRTLIESTFITLDGVISNPHHWGGPYWDDDHSAYAQKLLFGADELLLGRATYEGFAQAWPERSGDPYTDKINAMPARRLAHPSEATWNARSSRATSSTPSRLKARDGESLLKFGTGSLSRPLLEHG